MDIVGYTYQQEKSFDVMSKAAANQGSGVGATMMQAGMGLNIGMGMAAPIGATMGGIADNLSVKRIKETRCPECGGKIDLDANFCSYCGYKRSTGTLPSTMVACDKCGHKSPKGTRFCPNCGDPFRCCPNCGADNPDGAKVCQACGKSLLRSCVSCSATLPDGARFCPSCGKEV